ncbi:MAG: type II toxin-antitoxin system RelE/ParE family toxin [Mesorhizobium sp.]|nr:type II toxin-antitoxin system RelE/ParE family toxin [Mesorhizobium sp.]
MSNRVVLSTAANRDPKEIASRISADSPIAARGVMLAFSARFRLLGEQPLSGRSAIETAQPGMRRMSNAPYVIFYRIKADRIQVVRILHGSRRLDDPHLYAR